MLVRAAIVLISLGGCANHCQNLCENMADFARSECDLDVPGSQVDDCIAEFEDSSSDEEATCESNSDITNEEGWTCEMMASYFEGSGD